MKRKELLRRLWAAGVAATIVFSSSPIVSFAYEAEGISAEDSKQAEDISADEDLAKGEEEQKGGAEESNKQAEESDSEESDSQEDENHSEETKKEDESTLEETEAGDDSEELEDKEELQEKLEAEEELEDETKLEKKASLKASNEVAENAINFEELDTELYVGSDWAGADAVASTEGTKVSFDISNFGWAGNEWAIQYIIKNLGLKNNTVYTVEFDITSSVDKNIFLKLDDAAGFIAETVSLEADKTTHYSKQLTAENFSEKPYLFFALGQMSGETASLSGEIVLENLVITEVVEEVDEKDKKKGPEYDFTKDNSEFDAKDPGKTKDGYELIWADEFDGNYGDDKVDSNTGLNLDNWAYQLGDGTTDCNNYGWGNNELQCYTDRPDNVGVNEDLNDDGEGEGVLRITAKREDGYTYKNESAKNYTSARLRTTKPTEALFDTTYGYVEARIALPATAGAWPAFWMLPQSTTVYGNWPVSGEIDIMETCGAFTDKGNDVACGTLHWGTPTHVYKGSGYVNLDSDYTYFHTYAIDWQPGQIAWYYDGKAINTLTNWESAIPGTSDSLSFDAPFDMPFYMLLNLAVDSGQFGGGVNKAKFEDDINMYVDYVRVFQKEDGYADSVIRKASSGAADDWKDYAGTNQIADISHDALEICEGGGMSDSGANKDKWYLSYQQDATDADLSKYTDDDGNEWAKVQITSPGSQDYSVQLIGHYDAKAGYVYKVSFDAYADGGMVGKSVNCDSKEWNGWSTYGVTQAKLSKEKTHYVYTFQQTEDFDNCRIEFNLGAQASGNVYISNAKVEIVDPATLGTSEKGRTALSDGNMIYNGTFDQGDEHTGYWQTLAGTEIKVPRYTTTALADSDMMVIDVASKTNYESIADGKKYFERRAMISPSGKKAATIYQPGIDLSADTYTVVFDMYSEDDSAVKVGAYSLTSEDGQTKLGKELGSATAYYNKDDGVRTYTLTFNTLEDVKDAAIAFTFAKGTNVQIDKVYMNGANQKSDVDEHPLKSDASYRGDNGGGVEIPLNSVEGIIKMSDIVSGGNWYSPQLGSEDFELVLGQKYVLSFDYRLTGEHNNSFKYIVQENGGSWHVFAGGPENVTYDGDGFNHFEKEFVADASIPSVHLNFGFGDSGANGDMAFEFKNAKIDLVKQEAQTGDADNENVPDSVFHDAADNIAPKPSAPAAGATPEVPETSDVPGAPVVGNNGGKTETPAVPNTSPNTPAPSSNSGSGAVSGQPSVSQTTANIDTAATTAIEDAAVPASGDTAHAATAVSGTAKTGKNTKNPAKPAKSAATANVDDATETVETEDSTSEDISTTTNDTTTQAKESNDSTDAETIADTEVPLSEISKGEDNGYKPFVIVIPAIIVGAIGAVAAFIFNKKKIK